MPKILIVVDAPGPAEFIAPIIPELKTYDTQLVTIGESPTKILSKYRPARCDSEKDAEQIYKNFSPDALLIAMSSLTTGPYVAGRFTDLAAEESRPIICFQDFWANHRWPMNFKMMPKWNAVLTIEDRKST